MNIPVELFFGFIGAFFAFFVLGLVTKKPVMSIITGVLLLSLTLSTDNIIMDFATELDDQTTVVLDQQVITGQSTIHNGTNNIVARAWHVTASNSQLYGQTMNCMQLAVGRTGNPPIGTPVIFGVWTGTISSSIAETKYEFGRLNTTALTFDKMHFKLCNEDATVTLATGDRIGIMYRAGDASNLVSINENTNNPFDGTVTVVNSFNDATNTWTAVTTNDLGQITLSLEDDPIILQEEVLYEFTEFPKTVFALFSAILMLVGVILWRSEQTGDYPFDY